MAVFRYESLPDFLDSIDDSNVPLSSFRGHLSICEAKKAVHLGVPENIEEAEKNVSELDQFECSTFHQQWQANVAGAFPIVPASISGSPFAMNQKVDVMSEQAPINIYASCCASGVVTKEELRKRGNAILALVMKLSAVRPVNLYVMAELDGFKHQNGGSAIPCVKINTAPLDLPSASFCLSEDSFLRGLIFERCYREGYEGLWAYSGNPSNSSWQERIKEELGATSPNDLYIRGAYATDKSINEPMEWLKDRLKELEERGVI